MYALRHVALMWPIYCIETTRYPRIIMGWSLYFSVCIYNVSQQDTKQVVVCKECFIFVVQFVCSMGACEAPHGLAG